MNKQSLVSGKLLKFRPQAGRTRPTRVIRADARIVAPLQGWIFFSPDSLGAAQGYLYNAPSGLSAIALVSITTNLTETAGSSTPLKNNDAIDKSEAFQRMLVSG